MNLNWANRITILRILLIFPFVSCMLKINDPNISQTAQNSMRYVALGIFLVMAGSDFLDGYLARKKNMITQLGAFLDPMADKILMTCACLLLTSKTAGVRGFELPRTVVVLIIGKDLFLLMGFVVVHFITHSEKIVPAFIGKIATALQLTMVAAILIAPEVASVFPLWGWLLRILWWAAAATAILSTLIYIRSGSRYIEQYENNDSVQKQEDQ
jgi:CDP-diacylglycerol--glycerol-3-phosphate 3-phosphatidyltransferase